MDLIFIHGAPGSGKSTLAWALQARFQSPCFEFGWIPEFRVKSNSTISYEEEEALSFENLTLVLKNYVRHGFKNILVTDLRDPILCQVPRRFSRQRYLIVTLTMQDEAALKLRVLDETRSSGYRDWEEALAFNRQYLRRPLLKHEVRMDSGEMMVHALVEEVARLVD